MDSILDNDFDIDNPPATEVMPEFLRGDYHVKIKKYITGGCEVLMRVIKPMAQEKFAEQWSNHFPVSSAPKEEKSLSEIEAEKAANHRRAVRKAKQTVRDLANMMQADRLLTLTYRANVQDREKVKADFKSFLRLVRNGWKDNPGLGDWKYVAVLEKQDRGAFHIHCAVKGYQPIKFIRAAWYRALKADADVSGAETPGQVDITSPRMHLGASRKREWATHRLASYIVKYMSKTFDESTTEKNRYWRSKDIDPPIINKFWLVSTSLSDALNELWETCKLREGIDLRKHWLSDDDGTYWFRGVYDVAA